MIKTAKAWNKKVPPGTFVYYTGHSGTVRNRVRTNSEAEDLGDGSVLVGIGNSDRKVCISRLLTIPKKKVKIDLEEIGRRAVELSSARSALRGSDPCAVELAYCYLREKMPEDWCEPCRKRMALSQRVRRASRHLSRGTRKYRERKGGAGDGRSPTP